jgi:peptide/nickel transport system substrate-binding protein
MSFSARISRAAVALAVFGLCFLPAARAQAPQRTLRFIPQADLRSIDPIWTTAYVTRNFGYLVFDTLFALDKDFKPQPQMVDRWTVSDDKLSYRFMLRDGLKWHDGAPVRAADCVASLERWGKRDTLGQKLMEAVGEMRAVDEKTFTIALKSPFPLILDALGKPSSNVPFMMPERLAKTDAFQQIPEAIGSGPFKFVKEEWEPGHKAVFVKTPTTCRAKRRRALRPVAKSRRSTASSGSIFPTPRPPQRRSTQAKRIGTSSRLRTSCPSSPPTRTSSSPPSIRSAITAFCASITFSRRSTI